MLDANNAWSDLPTALGYCRRFEDYDCYWIEEPFSPDDVASHAELAARTSIIVATGEIEVEAEQIGILNTSKVPPFPIDDDGARTTETLRLKYRYLDLRRQRLHDGVARAGCAAAERLLRLGKR